MAEMVKPLSSPPPSARRSRGESAITRLRRDILIGRYRPGDRLPPERELSQRLGTNRNTLREALRTLESENLLRARQGDGTIVLDWRSGGEMTLLPWFLAEETPADERFNAVVTLLNLREKLLEEVLPLVILHSRAADFEAIDEALTTLAEARPGIEAVGADVEVYRRLVLASHSLVMIWMFNTFSRVFLELGHKFPTLWQIDTPYLEGLAQVLRRLREKNLQRAREELRHLFTERGMALVAELRPDAIIAETARAKKRPRR
jgi:DNA-binding FadR family transcriptional regulator